MAEVDWEARVTTEPWGVVMDALAHQARNDPVPDDLMEATEAAAVLLACVAFVRVGMTADEAFRLFDERDYTIHLRYKADEVTIDIQWEDGEVTTVDSDSAPIDSIVGEAERALRPEATITDSKAELFVAAWGGQGRHFEDRTQLVKTLAAYASRTLFRLGAPTLSGEPRHPARGPHRTLEIHW